MAPGTRRTALATWLAAVASACSSSPSMRTWIGSAVEDEMLLGAIAFNTSPG
jgi:hypothetical protein